MNYRPLLLIGSLALLLAGCAQTTGEKGDTGPAGTQGANGTPAASSVQQTLTLTITSASMNSAGKPVVKFRLLDQSNRSYDQLVPTGSTGTATSANVGATIAQLVPAANGNESYWYNYLITTETRTSAEPGYWPSGTTTRTVPQSTTENTTAFPGGPLTYDTATQTYAYTFGTAIAAVTPPTSLTAPISTVTVVPYNGAATHRVALELRNLTNAAGNAIFPNAVYDFVPSTGAAVTSDPRAIVDTATCNGCHGQLEAHGGRRNTVAYCPVCHNINHADANSGQVLDLKEMVHKIHMGGLMPNKIEDNTAGTASATPGADYIVWGFGNTPHNFSMGTFPLMTTSRSATDPLNLGNTTSNTAVKGTGNYFPDCTKCHVSGPSAPAQAGNWLTTPTQEACTSCHDNIVFDNAVPSTNLLPGINSPRLATTTSLQRKHDGGLQTNTACIGCHNSSGGTAGGIDTAHNYPRLVRQESSRWTFAIDSVTYNSASGAMTATFHINDSSANNGAGASIDYTDTTTNPGWLPANGAALTLVVGWPATEHINNFDSVSGASATPNPASVNTAAATALTVTLVGTTNVVTTTRAGTCGNATTAGTCAFTAVFPSTLPVTDIANDGNSLAIALYGRPGGSFVAGIGALLSTPRTAIYRSMVVKAAVAYFDVSGTNGNGSTAVTPTTIGALPRRLVVDTAKCQNCHGSTVGTSTTPLATAVGLNLHGGARAGNTQLCVMCHNPNNTDIVAGARNGLSTGQAADGLREQWVDFKYMIHAIHAGGRNSPNSAITTAFTGFRTVGVNVSGAEFSFVNFPNNLANCLACHAIAASGSPDTFALPLSSVVKPTTAVSVPSFGSGYASGPQNQWEASRHTFGLAASGNRMSNTGSTTATFTMAGQTYVTSVAATSGIPLRIVIAPGSPATLPAPFAMGVDYYAVNSTGSTFQLAASQGGTAIVETAVGVVPGTSSATPFTLLPRDYGNSALQFNMTPTAAACSGCHDSTGFTSIAGNSGAKAHMIQVGGAVLNTNRAFPLVLDNANGAFSMTDAMYSSAQTALTPGFETCAICHGPGGIADVRQVHGLP